MVERFSLAWDAAKFRKTTKVEDETVVLAGLLKLDPTSLIAAPVNEHYAYCIPQCPKSHELFYFSLAPGIRSLAFGGLCVASLEHHWGQLQTSNTLHRLRQTGFLYQGLDSSRFSQLPF
jgi:hypothetical protein